jgi:hypothetical protein
MKAGGPKNGIVYLHEKFVHRESRDGEHVCLVFETLGKSLYDFIKENGYKGRNTRIHLLGFALK